MSAYKPRILCVDDEEGNRQFLEDLLTAKGYDAVVASDGMEALDRLREGAFDLIVSDILMPRMDGFQLCRAVKADEKLMGIPFIFYSATYTGQKDIELGLSLGASRFMIKPADSGLLLQAFKDVIGEGPKRDHPLGDEMELFRQYNEVLFRKLEQKVLDLERVNQEREAEVRERKKTAEALRESEEKYRTLVESIPQKIFIKDRRLLYVSCNDNYARDLGIKPDEIAGKTDYDFYPRDLADKYRSDDMRLMDSGETEAFEEKYRQGGKEFWIYTHKTPFRDRAGNTVGILGVFSDITERKKAAEALRESSELNRQIIEGAQEGVIVYGPDLKYQVWNPFMERLTGFAASEVLGRHPLEVFPFLREAGIVSYVERAMKGETIVAERINFQVPDKGLSGWTSDISSPLRNARGEIIGVIGTVRDMTEYVRAEDALRESSELNRQIIEGAQEGLIVYGPDLKVQVWNHAMERLTGLPASEILGRHPLELFPPLRESGIMDCIEKALAGEPVSGVRYHFENPDKGISNWAYDMSSPLRNTKGEIIGVIGTVRDITEYVRAEDALKEEKTFIDNTLNVLKDLFFVFDLQGRFIRWNAAVNDVTGYGDAEIASMGPIDFFRDNDVERISGAVEAAVREGSASADVLLVAKDGRRIPYGFTASLLKDRQGNPIGVSGVGRDMTERKQLEEALRLYAENLERKVGERTRQLEDSNSELQTLNDELVLRREEADDAKKQADTATQAKSDFLANMSHELRTPLNSIIGFSEVLQDELVGPLNGKQREDMHYIISSGKHLLSLINDILDLSKVESGKMVLETEALSLREVLEATLVMQKEKALKHGIALILDVGPDADIEIEADERKLKQVLFNLLSNSVKFTPDGGSVSLAARKVTETDEMEISVSDTGIGIKKDDMPRLFCEFTQLQTAYTKEYEGTGLGLALTKKLIELHGGRIWVESEFGKGSRFAFVIPVRHRTQDKMSMGDGI